jgi:hypothetical protein
MARVDGKPLGMLLKFSKNNSASAAEFLVSPSGYRVLHVPAKISAQEHPSAETPAPGARPRPANQDQ